MTAFAKFSYSHNQTLRSILLETNFGCLNGVFDLIFTALVLVKVRLKERLNKGFDLEMAKR